MSDVYGSNLFSQHAAMLAASGVTPEHARLRGYTSVDTKARLDRIGVTKAGQRVPGLLVPLLRADGSTWGWQYRPDSPRVGATGKPVKYETPVHQRNGLDVPPGVGDVLGNPEVPIFVTEGTKKADAATLAGLPTVALPGVWSWRGRNEVGGKTAVPDWHDVALNGRRIVLAFDSDVTKKKSVRAALSALAEYLASKGALVEYLHLPDNGDGKTGLDDYLADGHTAADVWALVRPDLPEVAEVEMGAAAPPTPTATPPTSPVTAFTEDPAALLDEVETFIRRFCVLPTEHAYVATTTWACHTHFMDRLETSGRLACLSPEAASGKTRVLEVLDTICANPLLALDLSMSAFFRIVNDQRPTVLLDEVDAIFTGKSKAESTEDLRRVINNGYRVGAVVQRVGGQNRDEVQSFRVFTAVAMAGLGHLPDTLMSRSIILRMKRRSAAEKVEPWRDRLHRPEGEALQARLTAWASSTGPLAYPALPDGVHDRDADVWEPLIMVADLAGGDWPARVRDACLAFIAEKPLSTVSLGVRLLTDLRTIWPEEMSVMSTADILARLAELDEAPWADLYGEGLKPRKLAQLLAEYGAKPKEVRVGAATRKGYRREDLWDAWERYVTTPTHSHGMGNMGHKGNTAGQTVADTVGDVALSADPPEKGNTIRNTPQAADLRERSTVPHVADVAHPAGTGERTTTLPRCADCGNPIHPLAGGACLRCKYEADGGAA